MVAQNYRYRPLARTIKAVLDSGELGPVAAVQAEFYKGPHFGGLPRGKCGIPSSSIWPSTIRYDAILSR